MNSKKCKMVLMAIGLCLGCAANADGPVSADECEVYQSICYVQGGSTLHCQIVYRYCED